PETLGEVTTGDTGYLIARDPDTVRAPDVGFIRAERAATSPSDDTYWQLAPDLAVEILSPSDSGSDVLEKIDEWLDAGTRLVWVVDPAKNTVKVHAQKRQAKTLRGDDHLNGEDVLPGFDLPITQIFR